MYWQLSVPSGRYCAWLYYPEVTRDTLFRLQEDFVEPKLADERRKLREMGAGRADLTVSERRALEEQESFVGELQQFSSAVGKLAPLWNPHLDDGVVLTKAPLWRLAGVSKPWQKDLNARWNELQNGNYDWSHLSMHLWPERVVPKCATDRSLAIAHDLEDVLWIQDEAGKWKPRSAPTRSVEELVRERTSQAVKAALKDLLEAPEPAGTARRTRRKA